MGINNNDREAKAEKARVHTTRMTLYNNETNASIDASKIYSPASTIVLNGLHNNFNEPPTEFEIIDFDTVSTAKIARENNPDGKICILNFASYKNPGGKFLEGSNAQEESLCHYSNLYNILTAFNNDFYEWNRHNLNKSLYTNRAIYTPNVKFLDNMGTWEDHFDVLTCAAPNIGPGLKYCNVNHEENFMALSSRISFVLSIMSENNVDYPILGAFGCGVFKQNPEVVADIFKKHIFDFGFKKVYFGIPGGKNLEAFKKIFKVK